NAVSVDATASQRAALAALPGVDHVESVRRRPRAPAPPLPLPLHDPVSHGMDEFGWASGQLALIGAIPLQRHCGLTGAGVVVGVQDSGFELDHQALAGVDVLAAHDFINDDDIVANEPGEPGNQSGHGTLVLGTLAGSDPGTFMGVAPGIQVILSKTERVDAEIPAEEDYYVAGLEWIEAQGADIFTASLGYADWYSPADFDGQTAVTSVAVNLAFANGLLVLASMGNSGPGPSTLIAPADAPGALGVGATSLAGAVANFSSRGPTADGRTKPDVSAPGVDVASVAVGSLDQYTLWNGTSAAAPVAAGLAALVLEARPELTAQELADLLRDTASQAATPDNDLGWGIVDGRLATGDACGCNDTDRDGLIGVLCGGDDCNDGEPGVFPGAPEVCNGLDDDCDGALGEDELDEDGDGDVDCHDADCATHLACTCTLTPDEGFGQHVLCDDPVPWAAARDACEGSDMHLVSIESAAHDAWLVGHSQALDPISWWMGYSDLQVEGAWAWVDGTPPGYQHWFPGEPNNGIDTPEHCAAFPEHDGESWNDLDCAVLRPFVCER
ncbi:MAG: S8 family serine peptidase, partial [Myxococcales bacterium]|nr:S8 family serine peptidase [Myxococcales bacterium]